VRITLLTDSYLEKRNCLMTLRYQQDLFRYHDKVTFALKNAGKDLMLDEKIAVNRGSATVTVPLSSIKEYHFRFRSDKVNRIAHRVDTSRANAMFSGVGGSGAVTGYDYLDASITAESVAEIEADFFSGLCLPDVKRKGLSPSRCPLSHSPLPSKAGSLARIDRKRTIITKIKNGGLSNNGDFTPFTSGDLRFRAWEPKQKFPDVVVFAVLDTSASMGSFERYLARSFFYWLFKLLKTKYAGAAVELITYDTQAKNVAEYFFLNKGASGGTKASSAFQLALDLLSSKYRAAHGAYLYHISDGDNLPSDNILCRKLLDELLGAEVVVGYGELITSPFKKTSLLDVLARRRGHPNYYCQRIEGEQGVLHALGGFFLQ
jgi:uncharacterized sporulation protein YeaH/YhbH (DUF444 family)